jgi:hypothetical protein
MTHVALLALAPTFVKGLLVTICAVVLFIGSVYLLVSAVFGLRMGYLVVATSLFAWMIILAALWSFGFDSQGPGTPKNLGPRGTEAHWQVFQAATAPTKSVKFPETASYPDHPWWIPTKDSPEASAIPTVTTAFQTYLANQAQAQLVAQGQTDAEVDPSSYVVQDVRFLTAEDGTHLSAGTAFFSSGGPAITVYAYHDSGNVQIWSWLFLIVSIVGFLGHLPFLDRAERSRKEILTGGTAPAWYGPA